MGKRENPRKGLVEDLGNKEEAVRIVRGVIQNGRLGKTFRDSILADHVKDGDGMCRRLDSRYVEFVHLLDMVEDPPELAAEEIDFFLGKFQAGKARKVGNINRVMRSVGGHG